MSEISHTFTGHSRHWRTIGKLNQIQNDRAIPIGKKILIPTRLLKLHSTSAEIKHTFGATFIREQDGGNIAVVPGTLLKEGATLTTLANGFITLALDNGTQFTLLPNSSINLKLLRSTQYIATPRTQLVLQKGRVESSVTPFSNPESEYKVITPFAVSGVRGTRFRVNTDNNRVLNEVLEGEVAVQSGAAQTSHSARTRLVASGFGSIVEHGRVGQLIALPVAPTLHDGYQEQQRLPIQFTFSHPTATSFHLTVSTDADGHNMIAETSVDNTKSQAIAKLDNLEDGDYFVRYSALNASGLNGVSAIQPFRVSARPFPPFLLKPDAKFQGSETSERIPVVMQWTQTKDASDYRLQVAVDAAFDTTIVDQTVGPNTDQAVVHLQAERYYWRVATIGQEKKQGPFGDAKKLEVLPGMTAPLTDIRNDAVNFSWSANAGQKFTFQVAEMPTFATLLHDIETTQAEASIPPPDAGTYYARVRSIDADGFVGAFSAPQQFVIHLQWQTGYGTPLESMEQPIGTNF